MTWLAGFRLASSPQIFIDQRGTGGSPRPTSTVSSSTPPSVRLWPRRPEEAAEIADQALGKCAERLADVDLFDHTTTANHANDVEAIMRGLGYTRWTAYGVSYGSTIGFELLAVERDGLVGVVLDGVYPPDVDIEAGYAFSAQSSLDALTQACANDSECARGNADVGASVERLLARLASEPVSVSVDDIEVVFDDLRFGRIRLPAVLQRAADALPARGAGGNRGRRSAGVELARPHRHLDACFGVRRER